MDVSRRCVGFTRFSPNAGSREPNAGTNRPGAARDAANTQENQGGADMVRRLLVERYKPKLTVLSNRKGVLDIDTAGGRTRRG